MCNPKPGSRCAADARKPIANRVTRINIAAEALEEAKLVALEDYVEDEPFDVSGYRERLEEAADDYNHTMANFYSTSGAQKDKNKALLEGKELTNRLTPEAKAAAADEHVLYQAGRMTAVFHKAADKMRREESLDQLTVARKMNFGGFEKIHANNLKKIENDRDAKLGVALAGSDAPNYETEEIERQYNRNVEAANIAYRASLKDAADVINRDRAANSKVYVHDVDKREVTFNKTAKGSFHITTRLKMKAKDTNELEDKVADSFELEDVEIIPGGRDENGEYHVSAKYIYRGSEDIADAKKFHERAWRGTPKWRAALDEIGRVSSTPISYK